MKNYLRIKLQQCLGTFSLSSVNISKEEFLSQNARMSCFSNKEGKGAEGSNCNQRQVKEMKHRSVAILALLAMMLASLPCTMRQAQQLVEAAANRLWRACLDVLLSIPFDDAPQQDTQAVCQAQNDITPSRRSTNEIVRASRHHGDSIKFSERRGNRNSRASDFNNRDVGKHRRAFRETMKLVIASSSVKSYRRLTLTRYTNGAEGVESA